MDRERTKESDTLHRIYFCILLIITAIHCSPSHADDRITIGVLAKRGPGIALNRWAPLGKYLTKEIPNHSFVIQPLGFHEISNAVATHKVDFLLINPGIYVEMEYNYGVRPIATVRTKRGDKGVSLFAGLIITLSDRLDLQSFEDLRNKSFMAVDRDSLGGWLMAKRELEISGIDTETDFKTLSFAGTHDDVVLAVLNGDVDAGAVRSDILGHMAEEHLIDTNLFRVIHGDRIHFSFDIGEDDFPYPHSTDIYPEWPMVKLSGTPDELANELAIALLKMSSEEDSAKKAGIMGWDVARNYQSVHDLYRELRIGPYRIINNLQLGDVWQHYWASIIMILVFLSILCIMLFFLLHLRVRLLKANHKITHMAMHDPLTNLPNRRLFGIFADNAFAQARREGWKVYLLLIDLDGFKNINDNYGHEIGDKVLRQVSNRLRNSLPNQNETKSTALFPSLLENRPPGSLIRFEDPVARHGGDEFLSLLIHVTSEDDVKSISQRINDSIRAPIRLSGKTITVGASIGISVFPDDGNNLEVLIKAADRALYEVKRSGKGTYQFHGQSAFKIDPLFSVTT